MLLHFVGSLCEAFVLMQFCNKELNSLPA